MNASKTKYMSFNNKEKIPPSKRNDGTKLKNVTNFKHHWALLKSLEKDVNVRKVAP